MTARILLWLCFPVLAFAHDPGLSTVALTLEKNSLKALLTFAPADAEGLVSESIQGRLRQDERGSSRHNLEETVIESLEVRVNNDVVPVIDTNVRLDEDDNVHVLVTFAAPKAAHLRVHSGVLGRLPSGHRQYLSLRDRRGNLLGNSLLDTEHDVFETAIAESVGSRVAHTSFTEFLFLGVEHIAKGYDHILFLLALFIVGSSFLASVKIITSFTLAHSITLALATLQWVQLEPRLVEPLIAVSIVYIGIENMIGRNFDRRWLITFAFGLVHGLGFASVLRDLGVGSQAEGLAMALVSFNLGVEVGQLAIAALILPLIWKLKQHPFFIPRCVPALSVLVAAAGTFWLIERTLMS